MPEACKAGFMILQSLTVASDLSDLSLSAGAYNTSMLDMLHWLRNFAINSAFLMSLCFLFGVLLTMLVLMILEGIRHKVEAEKYLSANKHH
jgi:hypothetical protein